MQCGRYVVIILLIICKNRDQSAALPGIQEEINDVDISSQDFFTNETQKSHVPKKVIKRDLSDLNEIDDEYVWKRYEVQTGWTYKCEIFGSCQIQMGRPSVAPDNLTGKEKRSAPEIISDKTVENNMTDILKVISDKANRSVLIDIIRMTKLKHLTPLNFEQAVKNIADSLDDGQQETPLKPSTLDLLKESDDNAESDASYYQDYKEVSEDTDYDENSEPSFLELMSVAAKRKQVTS